MGAEIVPLRGQPSLEEFAGKPLSGFHPSVQAAAERYRMEWEQERLRAQAQHGRVMTERIEQEAERIRVEQAVSIRDAWALAARMIGAAK